MEGGAKPQIHDRHCCQLFTQPPEITLINLLEILPICMALKLLVVYEINLKVYNLVLPIPSKCQGRVPLPKLSFFEEFQRGKGSLVFNPKVYIADFEPLNRTFSKKNCNIIFLK